MNYKKIARHVTYVFGALSLAGCVTYGPGSQVFESQAGHLQYGQIENFSVSIQEACKYPDHISAPFCVKPERYVWATLWIGQRHKLYRSGIAIPADVSPEKGDIVAYEAATDKRTWNQYLATPAHSSHPDNSCRWEGSRIFSGGVVCRGWRWDKDFPPLSD